MLAQDGRQALGSDELDTSSQHRLEEIAEVHEVRERLLFGLKFDEQVHVTVGTRDVPANRSEQRQAPHAQTEDLGLNCLQASLHIGTGGGRAA